MDRQQFEIMAPAGSAESLAAAIEAGADAVYFGVRGLNMRSKSSANFTLDDLHTIVNRCKEAGVKAYLTVNTILYDSDMPLMTEILDAAKEAGVSAVIASDIAAIQACAERNIEVHISTQCNISNIEAVRFYAHYADVMVLARELNVEQVKAISQAIAADDIRGPHGGRIRLEMFCHGALCMAVSGKCYLSLHQMNSGANRGCCTQICRRGYLVTDLETNEELIVDNKYIMSPKDLKTIHFIDRLVDAGVTVFKIEGRARGPEYVYTTVCCYNEALQALCDGTITPERIAAWNERLSKVFNRGFWNGYYLGQRLGEWSPKYGSSATRTKQYVAKGVKYFSKLGVGEFLMEGATLCEGDEVVITGPTTGALITTVQQLHVDGRPATVAVKGDAITFAVPAKVRPADRLYRWIKTAAAE